MFKTSLGVCVGFVLVACGSVGSSSDDDGTLLASPQDESAGLAGGLAGTITVGSSNSEADEPKDSVDADGAVGGTHNHPSDDMQNDETPLFSHNNEQVACTENESYQSLLPILIGGRTHPTGRGEQASAYDPCNRRIILFGGNDFQPMQCRDSGPKRFQGDTWVYSIEYDNWVRLDTPVAPPARGRHTMAFDDNRKLVYLFGGRYRPAEDMAGNYTLFGDLWAFDVNTDEWTELMTTGDAPSARTNTAMVYDDVNDRLILFGGNVSVSGLQFTPLTDTYVLDLDTLVWSRLRGPSPPKRLFHSMVIDHNTNEMVLYGGGHEQAFFGDFYNDLWVFNLDDDIWEERAFAVGPAPDSRINSALVEDRARNRILMFAGHDETAVGHRNDVWALDTATGAWSEVNPGDTGTGEGCARFCSCDPDFVEVDMGSPERRQYHSFVPIYGEGRAILFGGKGDCGYLDDTWSFGYAEELWTEIEPAGQGEACRRTGQEGCTDLCY